MAACCTWNAMGCDGDVGPRRRARLPMSTVTAVLFCRLFRPIRRLFSFFYPSSRQCRSSARRRAGIAALRKRTPTAVQPPGTPADACHRATPRLAMRTACRAAATRSAARTTIARETRHATRRAALSDRPAPPNPERLPSPGIPALYSFGSYAMQSAEWNAHAPPRANLSLPGSRWRACPRGRPPGTCADARSVCMAGTSPTSWALRRADVYRAARVAS